MTVDFDDDISIFVRVHWITRVLFSVGLVLIAFTIYEMFNHPDRQTAIRLGIEIIVDFGLYKLAGSYIKVNHEYVAVSVPYGIFKIYWPEIKKIRTSGPFIGFFGDDKRVIISLTFANKHALELIEIVKTQAQKHKIEIAALQAGERMPTTHLNSRE
jgi:hypothetical protein